VIRAARQILAITPLQPKGFNISLSCGHFFISAQKAAHLRHTWAYCAVCPRQWSRHWDKCSRCGSRTGKYEGRGLCSKCYWLVQTPPGDYIDYSKNRRFHVNDYVLDDWTEASAYFVGVMYGDGCLPETKGKKLNRLEIHLKVQDRTWLEAIARLLAYEGRLREWEIHDNYRLRRVVSLVVSSRRLRGRLLAIGFRVKSTASIPDSVFLHFARGFFDADGSIYRKKSTRKAVRGKTLAAQYEASFTGQHNLLQEVAQRLHSLIGTRYPKQLYEKSNSPGTFSLRFHKAEVHLLYRAFYSQSTICLERKVERFRNLLKENEQHV
jgi:hypothetical protein